jgi:3-hydroxybutyryl-CoA dehydrogenase
MNRIEIQTVAVVGAGTMGQGIAQVCAAAGYKTLLYDVSTPAVEKGIHGIQMGLDSLLRKGRLTEDGMHELMRLISPVYKLEDLKADLIIEAVVENLETKKKLFQEIETVNERKAILATNTSSLSVTKLAEGLRSPEMFLGIHFFNPAPVMKLVEIIAGDKTEPRIRETIREFLVKTGKTVVNSADNPGFIVNRIARPFYLESLKILEENAAQVPEIDLLMRSAGFKMGPFELMDLIGIDINYAVSVSVYNAFNQEPRFKPNKIQQQKVEEGSLGRKTGRGFYEYLTPDF